MIKYLIYVLLAALSFQLAEGVIYEADSSLDQYEILESEQFQVLSVYNHLGQNRHFLVLISEKSGQYLSVFSLERWDFPVDIDRVLREYLCLPIEIAVWYFPHFHFSEESYGLPILTN